MDLTSLFYFSELAKDLHMTRTAKRLFISQQTLSNHILRLEEQLGVQLLHRKPSLSLTCAGEAVLSFAQGVNIEYGNLKDLLADIEKQERGILHFGASPFRMNTCLPNILPVFSARYPNVELRLTDAFSGNLESMVLDGILDFAIVLSEDSNATLIEYPLINDQIYLCATDTLLEKYYGDRTEALKEKAVRGIRVADFAALPFCLHDNRFGKLIKDCFAESDISPKTYLSGMDTQMMLSLCFQHLAACFATQMRLFTRQKELPKDINLFPVYKKELPLTQRIVLIRRKDRYLTGYSHFFLELLFQYFNDAEQIPMTRKGLPTNPLQPSQHIEGSGQV